MLARVRAPDEDMVASPDIVWNKGAEEALPISICPAVGAEKLDMVFASSQ